jgi:hypothetical protein
VPCDQSRDISRRRVLGSGNPRDWEGRTQTRIWRNPGKLRPSAELADVPGVNAKQGAQRGEFEVGPPLLSRNSRSSAASTVRTTRSTRWRDALVATSGSVVARRSGPAFAWRRPSAWFRNASGMSGPSVDT